MVVLETMAIERFNSSPFLKFFFVIFNGIYSVNDITGTQEEGRNQVVIPALLSNHDLKKKSITGIILGREGLHEEKKVT